MEPSEQLITNGNIKGPILPIIIGDGKAAVSTKPPVSTAVKKAPVKKANRYKKADLREPDAPEKQAEMDLLSFVAGLTEGKANTSSTNRRAPLKIEGKGSKWDKQETMHMYQRRMDTLITSWCKNLAEQEVFKNETPKIVKQEENLEGRTPQEGAVNFIKSLTEYHWFVPRELMNEVAPDQIQQQIDDVDKNTFTNRDFKVTYAVQTPTYSGVQQLEFCYLFENSMLLFMLGGLKTTVSASKTQQKNDFDLMKPIYTDHQNWLRLSDLVKKIENRAYAMGIPPSGSVDLSRFTLGRKIFESKWRSFCQNHNGSLTTFQDVFNLLITPRVGVQADTTFIMASLLLIQSTYSSSDAIEMASLLTELHHCRRAMVIPDDFSTYIKPTFTELPKEIVEVITKANSETDRFDIRGAQELIKNIFAHDPHEKPDVLNNRFQIAYKKVKDTIMSQEMAQRLRCAISLNYYNSDLYQSPANEDPPAITDDIIIEQLTDPYIIMGTKRMEEIIQPLVEFQMGFHPGMYKFAALSLMARMIRAQMLQVVVDSPKLSIRRDYLSYNSSNISHKFFRNWVQFLSLDFNEVPPIIVTVPTSVISEKRIG